MIHLDYRQAHSRIVQSQPPAAQLVVGSVEDGLSLSPLQHLSSRSAEVGEDRSSTHGLRDYGTDRVL